MKRIPILVGFCALTLCGFVAHAQSPYQSSADFAKYAQKLRENALLKMEPTVQVQTSSRATSLLGGRYPWKKDIVTTVFWIGEGTTARNPVPNRASSWDSNWLGNYGGVDRPDRRNGYVPAAFVPGQNPFYCALPYNDVTRGTTKPEASFVIPWFRQAFQKVGQSVCKSRWLAIRHGNRVCYAQWEDCGPFRTDHWQYVFGKEARPKPNINGGAGLDVSPAVRDFLGMNATKDVCDWKFVDFSEVPSGPWAKYGENNTFVLNARRGTERVASGKR
ncbi:MAG: hypothetical protein NTZ46_08735 [Verrucomicrobia bacterium]|nr:hypothetical protein [Verrucomicrobiota bacterium]